MTNNGYEAAKDKIRSYWKSVYDERRRSYNENPNLCLSCGHKIPIPDSGNLSETLKKKFCNRNCAGKYNNDQRCSNNPDSYRALIKIYCACGSEIERVKLKGGRWSSPKSCTECKEKRKAEAKLKGKLIDPGRGYTANRSSITGHAQRVYKQSNKPKYCISCGYNKHYDVCHIRAVKDFPDDALFAEINHIDNLIALCKNCHWEFDRGMLALELNGVWVKVKT